MADVNRHIKSGVLQIAPPSSGLLGCVLRCYLGHMTLKARVKAGRLVVESLTPEDADRYIKVIPPDCDDKRIPR